MLSLQPLISHDQKPQLINNSDPRIKRINDDIVSQFKGANQNKKIVQIEKEKIRLEFFAFLYIEILPSLEIIAMDVM
jgi:hypothetical protein